MILENSFKMFLLLQYIYSSDDVRKLSKRKQPYITNVDSDKISSLSKKARLHKNIDFLISRKNDIYNKIEVATDCGLKLNSTIKENERNIMGEDIISNNTCNELHLYIGANLKKIVPETIVDSKVSNNIQDHNTTVNSSNQKLKNTGEVGCSTIKTSKASKFKKSLIENPKTIVDTKIDNSNDKSESVSRIVAEDIQCIPSLTGNKFEKELDKNKEIIEHKSYAQKNENPDTKSKYIKSIRKNQIDGGQTSGTSLKIISVIANEIDNTDNSLLDLNTNNNPQMNLDSRSSRFNNSYANPSFNILHNTIPMKSSTPQYLSSAQGNIDIFNDAKYIYPRYKLNDDFLRFMTSENSHVIPHESSQTQDLSSKVFNSSISDSLIHAQKSNDRHHRLYNDCLQALGALEAIPSIKNTSNVLNFSEYIQSQNKMDEDMSVLTDDELQNDNHYINDKHHKTQFSEINDEKNNSSQINHVNTTDLQNDKAMICACEDEQSDHISNFAKFCINQYRDFTFCISANQRLYKFNEKIIKKLEGSNYGQIRELCEYLRNNPTHSRESIKKNLIDLEYIKNACLPSQKGIQIIKNMEYSTNFIIPPSIHNLYENTTITHLATSCKPRSLISPTHFEQTKSNYLTFIGHSCLRYEKNLKQHVLKRDLWGIHVYIAEFYFYIMWKWNDIYMLRSKSKEKDEHIAKHLQIEMNSIHAILLKYKIIYYSKIDNQKESNKLISLVKKFRWDIFQYLKDMHHKSVRTSLYFFALKIQFNVNQKKPIKPENTNNNKKEFFINTKTVYYEENKMANRLCYTTVAKSKSPKNMLLILAFTINELEEEGLQLSEVQKEHDPGKRGYAKIFYDKFYRYKHFQESLIFNVLNIINFVKFIKGVEANNSTTLLIFSHYTHNYLIYINENNKDFYEIKVLTHNYALNFYGEYLQGLMLNC